MGEVYRARDTKLNREVALKVLPAATASDPERLRRFEREAQMLAALNHQNIASIYGIESNALVMELVEGEMLSGPKPVDEVIVIAKQIAEALEYAHEKGIIHRDLKPANIKVTPQGQVKVLDFGLAKALQNAPSTVDAANSPTVSLAATQMGVILGTAAYMAPEQAKGQEADRRADIWSFGVVLLELFTGERGFPGSNASEVMAAVILKDPVIPPGLPPHLDRLLRRCLVKDPRQRLQAIGEARITLSAPDVALGASGATLSAPAAVTPDVAHVRQPPSRERLWMAIAAAAIAVAITLWAPWRGAPKPQPVRRTSIALGADVPISLPSAPMTPSLAISPDGTWLVFVGGVPGAERPQLYLRRFDQLRAAAIPGTDGASVPFFSPDNAWIAFFAGGKLKKIHVQGGAATTLCDAMVGVGGAWSEDGTIYFTPNRTAGLMRISSAGGTPAPFTTPDPKTVENAHRWPQVLQGGKAVLYTSGRALSFNESNIVVKIVATGKTKVIEKGGFAGHYLAAGYLVFLHDDTLFAAPFDLDRLELTAQPVPLIEGITTQPSSGAAQISYANDGTTVYLPGTGMALGNATTSGGVESSLLWLDRAGKTQSLRKENAKYSYVHFSPDGHSLATQILDGRSSDLWVYQWEHGIMSRMTHDGLAANQAAWSPDGRRIAYVGYQPGSPWSNVYLRPADGTGESQRLTDIQSMETLGSIHPSGKWLAFVRTGTIMILPLPTDQASAGKPVVPYTFVPNPNDFIFSYPAFSPDGRWLAYQSNETGAAEIYVRPFPGPGGKWQVSTQSGQFPAWSRTGKELLYLTPAPDSKIMTVGYTVKGDAFQATTPRPWSASQPTGIMRFDPHPDGKRLAILQVPRLTGESTRTSLVMVENFFEELRRVAPVKK